jgi:amino acid transporter
MAVFYALVQLVSTSVMPDLATSTAPLADVATIMIGSIGGPIMIGAAFLSIAGNLSAMMVAAPRMTFAMARMNMVPIVLGKAHVKYSTPANSIVLFGVLGLVLAVTGSFIWLALMSSLARLLGYALSIGALPIIRRAHPDATQAFALPGGMLFPIVALSVCLVLAWQASVMAWIVTGVFILIGSLLYYYSSRNTVLKAKEGAN